MWFPTISWTRVQVSRRVTKVHVDGVISVTSNLRFVFYKYFILPTRYYKKRAFWTRITQIHSLPGSRCCHRSPRPVQLFRIRGFGRLYRLFVERHRQANVKRKRRSSCKQVVLIIYRVLSVSLENNCRFRDGSTVINKWKTLKQNLYYTRSIITHDIMTYT